jgi:hypothetical protein
MPANENPDPTIADADRRVERAKASLLARIDLLKGKIGDAKHQLDFKAQIAKHPMPAIGIAFAVGALAALGGRAPAERSHGEHSLTGAALGALAAFGLRLVRELAIGQLGNAARQWWNEQQAGGGPVSRSRAADLEPFLEH